MLTYKTLSYITLSAMTHPWTCCLNLKWSSPRMDQPTHLSFGPVSFTFLMKKKEYRKAVWRCASLTWLIRYLAVSDFKRYLISTFSKSVTKITIFYCYRFCEISHQNHNISCLQILWEHQYLLFADFVRYYTKTTKSHSCRFHESLQQNHNISWLQISWDITL